MVRWCRVLLSGLLPAAILGVVGSVVATVFLGGRAYWGRGESLDLFGLRVEQPAAPAVYSLGSTFLSIAAGVFVLGWLGWTYSTWAETKAEAAGPGGRTGSAEDIFGPSLPPAP